MYRIIGIILTVCFISACNPDGTSRYKPKTAAFGKMNDVVVVCDQNLWESFVGDTFAFYYESAYPVMNQPEPLFDLRHMPSEELLNESLKQELRTYVVLCNLGDANSPTTQWVKKDLGEEKFARALKDSTFFSSVGADKWAKEQLIIYLFGKDLNVLSKAITTTFPAVAKRIQDHDKRQLEANVFSHKKDNNTAHNQIMSDYGLDIRIPADYVKAPLKADFAWYRKDFKGMSQHILIAKRKYNKAADFSKDSLLKWRDKLTRNIQGGSADSYMKTNVTDLPVYEYAYQLNGAYTKELRGIWEMENDFMGGPYFNYTLLDAPKNEIIMVDVFVFAPGKDKRDYMQQLDHIAKTARIAAGK